MLLASLQAVNKFVQYCFQWLIWIPTRLRSWTMIWKAIYMVGLMLGLIRQNLGIPRCCLTISKGSKAKGKIQNKSNITDAAGSRIENYFRGKSGKRKLEIKCTINENGISDEPRKTRGHAETGSCDS
ncbi:hypothetical protein Nepgr_002769 [Nepenthes gracilis]|uniref:Uncharacterized protein n=1 Tax=Nepenthes gracilis TaxID=150966 RepID=A0AAD3P499_NEPGR|nr:hypothetical protein Nepgr_002769 [Nepenthes gracilis]